MLPAAKGLRDSATTVFTAVAGSIERIAARGTQAEVRTISGISEFEKTTTYSDRLVIVSFRDDMSEKKDAPNSELDAEIKKLPADVLFAKVMVEYDRELMNTLNIEEVPAYHVYHHGKLLRIYSGNINKEDLITYVKERLDDPAGIKYKNPNKKNMEETDPELNPLDEGWLPRGVQPAKPKKKASAKKINNKASVK